MGGGGIGGGQAGGGGAERVVRVYRMYHGPVHSFVQKPVLVTYYCTSTNWPSDRLDQPHNLITQ